MGKVNGGVLNREQVDSDDYNIRLYTGSFHFIKIMWTQFKKIVMTKKFFKLKLSKWKTIKQRLSLNIGDKQIRKHTKAMLKCIYSTFIE